MDEDIYTFANDDAVKLYERCFEQTKTGTKKCAHIMIIKSVNYDTYIYCEKIKMWVLPSDLITCKYRNV